VELTSDRDLFFLHRGVWYREEAAAVRPADSLRGD
jgi:hypothetical protein